ncbi:MAG: hypothetical protein BWK73_30340 [Thiothrix lacustris]|uniref:Uncharacterized protein n=1 Tax=Thiothrix lacustris TaxID=525917 RepID=A0A1Y1QJ22_9GAMM|nr:MAG: hypothetical protein BWK73_30340 [Thiothrix lacustris]
MFKFILSVALLMASAVASADTNTTAVTASVAKAIPVIIKNEQLDTTMCRLHFEDGTQKEVKCASTNEKAS